MRVDSLRNVQRIAALVDGWLGKREGPYLYALAKIGSCLGVVVEIGSWKGKSTIWLANGSLAVKGGKVYAIDPHVGGPDQEMIGLRDVRTEAEFRDNLRKAGVESAVVSIVKPSMEVLKAWDKPIGLLWIDGDHRYESVRDDFFGWEPHVGEGGLIALHDTYSWEGVRRFVDEDILRSERFKVLGQVDSILAVKRVSALSLADRLKRGSIVYVRGIYNRARAKRKHWRALPRKLLRGISVPRVPT